MKKCIVFFLMIAFGLCLSGCKTNEELSSYALKLIPSNDTEDFIFELEIDGVLYRSVEEQIMWYPIKVYEEAPIGQCKYLKWKTYIYKTSSHDCIYIQSAHRNRPPHKYLFRAGQDVVTFSYDDISEAIFKKDKSKKTIFIDFDTVKALLENKNSSKKMRVFDTEWEADLLLRSENRPGLESSITIRYNRQKKEHYLITAWLEDNYIEGIPCEDFYQKCCAQLERMP